MSRDTASGLQPVSGWGRASATVAHLAAPATVAETTASIGHAGPRGVVPRGLGRAYGDAAQNAGGVVLTCTALDTLGEIDEHTGEVTVGGGASLGSLIAPAIAAGWFLPVTPGTRHITVGGAIAADVHGKNHHVDGTFSRHVAAITLLLASGEVREVTPEGDPALFWATAGGMGLTGVVLAARIRLTRAETRFMQVDTRRAADLDAVLSGLEAGDGRHRYGVAWIDLLARGRATGRGVLSHADHAPASALSALSALSARERGRGTATPRALPSPPGVVSRLLGRPAVQLFNELWFRKAPADGRQDLQSVDAFFYPLDMVNGWNRAYGQAGFVQWQCVLPFGAEDVLREVVGRLAAGPVPATLAVLKRFGEAGAGHLSFPIPGWTLAVDLPAVRASGLDALLDALDRLVAEHGGRIYLAKDARMRPEWLPVMYPRLDEWRSVQAGVDPNGRFTSDLDRRLGLTVRAGHALGTLKAVAT